ncbi:SRPBCC domain-containing protein [Amycolatopsis alkalitolerans]|uniref:Transcriptional regulator n=1 Tax=Amycolatopsis alkalitolerans TaxID=2547244 RepID=A0A5C4M054_9PSEU|nr:SRPBCC domain-containing protein [Amycolatopsis alkalitolerans]TNC24840.1 transcriptional regulator [Amycolatopsis alkalitolerans]
MTMRQVHRIYIKADPEKVWDAIIKPEWTDRYGYGGLTDFDLTPGARFHTRPSEAMIISAKEQGYPMPDTIVDGEVVEAKPPSRLVLKWRMLMDPDVAAEGFSTLTYEITESAGGVKLTVVHELEGMPKLAALVDGGAEATGGGGGWPWILSDLKSLLETGKRLAE